MINNTQGHKWMNNISIINNISNDKGINQMEQAEALAKASRQNLEVLGYGN